MISPCTPAALTADEIAAHYRASGLTPPRPVPPPKTAPVQAIRPCAPADLERYAAAIRQSQPRGLVDLARIRAAPSA